MTFSLAARCARTGRFGVVISSSSPAVAARCAHAAAGVGAACSQNITDPRLGQALLRAMADGADAETALARLVEGRAFVEYRQLTCVDVDGGVAAFSGSKTLGQFATAKGAGAVAAGNLLASPDVPAMMVAAFAENPEGELGDRLIAGLQAGLAAGGEAGPVHSAGLLVVDDVAWPVADLRVDWADDPVGELAALWRLWRPLMADYVTRALDPSTAPAYGVPGDEG